MVGLKVKFKCTNVPIGNLTWEVTIPGEGVKRYSNTEYVEFTSNTPGTVTLKAYNTAGCPEDNFHMQTMTFGRLGLVIHPINPVSSGDEINAKVYAEISGDVQGQSCIATMSSTGNSVVRIPYDGSYVVEIWDSMNGKVAAYDCIGADVSVPSAGLTKGVYYLKLVVDGKQSDVAGIVVN